MKRATIVLEDSVHKAAKIKAVMQDKSFIQYVADLVEEDVQKDLQVKKEQTHQLWSACDCSKKKPVNGISMFIIRDSSPKIKENLKL